MWQAGGVASRGAPIVDPDSAKGLKIRGGSREMDMMLKAAGARGWLDERQAALESLTAIVRAGADLVVSYWTKELAGWL